ncbi:unnamed protein product [Caenorhabditis angaria]|uniref:Uncharacterized protein n=1 Tax=Caenorhabditis angaria TaxID=860376 RepID=A0A9P1IYC3_9PELO|nr:unnamed protein product [Caenorhabditis angaria]
MMKIYRSRKSEFDPAKLNDLSFSTFRANDEVFKVICCPGNEIAKYHLNLAQSLVTLACKAPQIHELRKSIINRLVSHVVAMSNVRAKSEVFEVIGCPGIEIAKYRVNNSCTYSVKHFCICYIGWKPPKQVIKL